MSGRPARTADTSVLHVRRRGLLLGAVGLGAVAVATAYLGRAMSTGSLLDWTLTGVLGALALVFLAGAVDARSPLLVADDEALRVRRGRTWTAWRWAEVTEVDVQPASRRRDGFLEVATGTGERARLRLGLGAHVVSEGDPASLLADLRDAALSAPQPVLDVEPPRAGSEADPHSERQPHTVAHWRDPRPVLASGIAALADRIPSRGARLPLVARHQAPVADGSLALDIEETVALVLPEHDELHRSDDLTELLGGHRRVPGPAVTDEELTEAIVVPVTDPVIGPRLAQARGRLGLRIGELSERTRIRGRVIEAIEQDDFAACGGDFYARGHLRTLARVLGLDAAPLLAEYDERYAAAPAATAAAAAARMAQLPVREPAPPRQSPRWSVLVAAVMAVVLAWSVARLVLDTPTPADRVPGLGAGSGGVHGAGAAGKAVPVLLRAAGGGAHVVVRDGNGRLAYTGNLAFGESRSLEVIPPIRLDSSDGGVVVIVNGEDRGRLGELGRPATALFDGG